MPKRALITGIAGQDGTYLTELLVSKGYEVFGLLGPEPGDFEDWAAGFGGAVHSLAGDLTGISSLLSAVEKSRPNEVYNFAAMSFPVGSWERAVATTDVNATGVVRLLEALRTLAPEARFFQPSSAEVFGNSTGVPQTESTPMRPRSPYGATKAFDLFITTEYRQS
jgi:GDPmannose 4,6-dehydratase